MQKKSGSFHSLILRKTQNLTWGLFWVPFRSKATKQNYFQKLFASILRLCYCNFMQKSEKIDTFTFDNT